MRKIKSKNIPKIVVILGPTASGKSDLGIEIARKFKGEIISADSRQIYRGMDIGTGKVNKKEQRLAKHHLIDIVNPKKIFTASDFQQLGRRSLNDITNRSRLPIIVGGTGFYIDVLLGKMAVAKVPPNRKLRAELAKQSAEQLFAQLEKLDLFRAKTIDPKNKRRLIRSLEIVLTTKKPVPKLNQGSRIKNYDVLWIGLRPKNLEERIKIRLDKRLKQGMVKEVGELHRQGVSWKRLDDLGLEYRQISRYLKTQSKKGKLAVKSPKDFRNSEYYNVLLREIIKYSKRQITWFKRNKEIKWIKNLKQARGLVKKFLYSAARTIER